MTPSNLLSKSVKAKERMKELVIVFLAGFALGFSLFAIMATIL